MTTGLFLRGFPAPRRPPERERRRRELVEAPPERLPEVDWERLPEYLSPEQAKEAFGVDLQPGWQLRIKRTTLGVDVRYITPDKWEILEGGKYFFSPEGKFYSAKELERERRMALLAPEQFERERLARAAEIVFPENEIESLFREMAILPDMPEPERIGAEQAQWDFVDTIRAEGRTWQTEALLRQLGATEDEINEFFPTPAWDEAKWWAERYAGMSLPERAWNQFLAGIGDVFITSGGVARRFDYEDVGATLSAMGSDLQRYAPPSEGKEFEFMDLLNPEFYAEKITRAIPFALSLAPLAIGGFYAGAAIAGAAGLGAIGSMIVGGFTGAALSRPLESALEAGAQFDDAIARGKTRKEAEEEFDRVFRDNMTLAGADAFEIMIALAPTPKWVPMALVKSNLVRTIRIGGKMVIVGLSEGGEEIYQDLIQRRARGEEWQWDPISKEVFAIGLIMGMGMGLGGDVVQSIINRSKDKMSPPMKRDFDSFVSSFREEGFMPDQAELRALDRIARALEGQKIVAESIKEAKREIPIKPAIPEVVPEVKPLTEIKGDLTSELKRRLEAGEKLPVGVPATERGITKHIEGMSESMLRDWHSTIFPVEEVKAPPIVEKVPPPAKPPTVEKVKPPTPEEISKTRQTIMSWVKTRGFTQKQYRDMFMEYGKHRQLHLMTPEQLQDVLAQAKVARPRTIKGKRVVTQKTERKIETLKDTLIRNKQLTQKSFDHIVEQLKLSTTRYETATKFITEGEAKSLIRAMNDEAILAEWDIKVEEALDRHPDIKVARDGLNARSVKEREVTFDGAPIRVRRGNELRSMRFYVLKLQKELNAPVYDIWQKINMAHLAIRQKQKALVNKLEASTPEFMLIAKDEEALLRVENYIAAKHKMGPKSPPNITAEEIKLATELERQLFEFRNDVRYARFTEAYAGHSGDVDMIARDIPDANKRALRRAADIFEGKGATELRKFLDTQEWGVIRTGYDPRSIVKPRLHLYTAKPTTFAKGHIQTRRGIEYTTEERTIIQRYRSYAKQMMGLTDLSPLIRAFDRVFTENAPKLENYRPVANVLSRGLNEMKGYREDGGFIIHMMERMYATVASAVFWRPDLVLRNKFQNFAFNPDYHAGRFLLPRKPLTEQRRLWFEAFVSQEKGIEQDYLLYSETPFTGLKRLTNWAHRTSLYPWSDKSNRAECFQVRIDRVDRALVGYQKDGDLNKLINNSGLLEFEARQQAEALELLAMDRVDYGVEGVGIVSGYEAFARYNAQQLTNNVHFLYDRAQRAPAEMGASGKTLGNILVFSRSWGERLILQGNKLADPKASTREKILATRIIVGIVVAGLIAGEAYKWLTGKTHNPYNPLNILTWTPGGLIVGVAEDISNVIYWMTQAIQGNERALGQLPGLITIAATLTLPFYKNFIQIADSITDMKGIDVYAIRKIREMIDEEYEIRGGIHEVERTLFEKIQHALLAGRVKPDTPQEKVADAEEGLGLAIEEEEDMPFSIEEPDIYDMRKLNSDFGRFLKDIDPEDITKANKYSDKAIGWVEKEASEAIWQTYPNVPLYKINADPKEGDTFEEFYQQWRLPEEEREVYEKAYLGNFSQRQLNLLRKYHGLDKAEQAEFLDKNPELKLNLRDEWLKENPKDNARLAVWGQAKILSLDAYNEVKRLIKVLDIPDDAIPEFTLPPEGSVESHFKYLETGEEFGWNSWETQLVLAKDDAYREWRGLDPIETPIASLELKVKHRELFNTISRYSDKDSPLYIEDDEARDEARDKLKADNPEWVDDIRRIEAIEHNFTEKSIEEWVERGRVVDEFNAGSSEAKIWLIDHPETFKQALDVELLTDDGSDWNIPVLRLNAKWREQDEKYEGFGDKESPFYIEDDAERQEARDKYLARDEYYRKDRRRREAYGDGFPEEQIENFVEYHELPTKGFRQERFLIENKGFAKAMHEIKGIDLPDPKKVPAIQYDEIYEANKEQFDKLWGLGDHTSEYYIEDPDKRDKAREAMRRDARGNLTEFGIAEIRLSAYANLFPEDLIDTYVAYYSLERKGYADEWFLMEHSKFYNTAKKLLGWQPRDFTKVPTRAVWAKYVVYQGLPLGQVRLDFRAQNPDLEEWLVSAKGYKPLADRGDEGADLSRWERLAEELASLEERLRKLRE